MIYPKLSTVTLCCTEYILYGTYATAYEPLCPVGAHDAERTLGSWPLLAIGVLDKELAEAVCVMCVWVIATVVTTMCQSVEIAHASSRGQTSALPSIVCSVRTFFRALVLTPSQDLCVSSTLTGLCDSGGKCMLSSFACATPLFRVFAGSWKQDPHFRHWKRCTVRALLK